MPAGSSGSMRTAVVGGAVLAVLAVLAGYAFASAGPTSLHARWRRQATRALLEVDPAPSPLTEKDLVGLPGPLAAYVRRSGAIGRPRVVSVDVTFHGRIRGAPDQPWMSFTGRQVNTYGPRPQRAFLLDATRSGLPVTVLHQYADATATMRAKVLSLVPVLDAAGPEMDQGETVTVLNDLVVLAPGAIADAPVRWTALDDTHVRAEYTDGDRCVCAVLTFDAAHDLVDFTSEDRFRASPDGRSFTRQRWSTPLRAHRDTDGRRVLASGAGRWHPPHPGPAFTYVEIHVDDVRDNPRGLAPRARPDGAGAPGRRGRARPTVETGSRGSRRHGLGSESRHGVPCTEQG
ncbi:DUF6544 family protein [Cellulomonas sp. S1-8]|uniref:DUF6544 family protein n=1 Tax=Cellulomonas sp. S1-8 TaxID=2904790 RepID=UPI002243E5F7|nr:DUF6544 family protein [Cellulomonas sp. S1-8]UZN04975.1 hypothetical protein OKX07_08790 [Cellulomonas sp. S1-8]